MQILNLISNNYFFIIILSLIFVGVLVNVLTKMVLKSGEVAVSGGKSVISGLFNSIKYVLIIFKDLLAILFKLLVVFIAYILNMRRK